MGETFGIYLDRITDEVMAALPGAAFKAMEHVRGKAVELAPIETGDLRASAETKESDKGADVYFPGPYARYQEYGVSKYGKPLRHEEGQSFYLITALTQETPKVLEILTEELRKVID